MFGHPHVCFVNVFNFSKQIIRMMMNMCVLFCSAGIGVPILLAYVYGVVPISLCRSGGCGVRTTDSGGVRIDIDENEVPAAGSTGPFNGEAFLSIPYQCFENILCRIFPAVAPEFLSNSGIILDNNLVVIKIMNWFLSNSE